ncbi:exonuclease [uncultured Caudovirales phage]|uniref:Exonuclease n=1 Tax=uncultured Caudovirales phage TaxID=2100421 RepID=A0A6J5TA18_9CAUD|nr:exonuclease [uncultured Caudovirales phage]
MKALVDGDIVVYRAAASAEEDDQWVALARADKLMQDILEETTADSYNVYLTGSGNFRREIAPSYKAQRPDARPKHWQAVREFLVTQHKAIVCDGFEADDQLGIDQDKTHKSTVICSIDKDLLQIPGRHYNFVKKVFQEVTHDEGIKFLYIQSLVGDRSDNIFGVQGIGPVKAAKALDGLLPEEYYDKCRAMYNDDERYHLNMQLLYIWQKPNDMWKPPITPQSGEPTASEFTPTGKVGNTTTQQAAI